MLPSVEAIRALPQTHHQTIPDDYRDEMGHMNVMYYMGIFDRAAWQVFAAFGADLANLEAEKRGVFALEQHLRYLQEVHIGQTVSVYSRYLAASDKRLHFMSFMVNDDTEVIAATFEAMAICIDLNTRRSTTWQPHIRAKMDALIAEHIQLTWDAPQCGTMHP